MKNILSKIKDILIFPLFLLLLVLIVISVVIALPFDYIKYRRSPFYKKERRKYTFMTANGINFELYNEIARNDLPIRFTFHPEEPSIHWGIFTLGDTLIITDASTASYNVEDGIWCVSYEKENDIVSVPLGEYISSEIKTVNETFGKDICRDAVVLLSADNVDENVEHAMVEKRLLVYDKNRENVLKAFCQEWSHAGTAEGE